MEDSFRLKNKLSRKKGMTEQGGQESSALKCNILGLGKG